MYSCTLVQPEIDLLVPPDETLRGAGLAAPLLPWPRNEAGQNEPDRSASNFLLMLLSTSQTTPRNASSLNDDVKKSYYKLMNNAP